MQALATLTSLTLLFGLTLITGAEFHAFLANAPVRVIGIAGTITVLLQIVKRFFPALGGWWAIAVNVTLAIAGVLLLTDPSQFYTVATAGHILEAALAAAGIHGTVKAMSNQQTANPPATPIDQTPTNNAPATGGIFVMKSTTPVLLFIVALLAFTATGCSDWERTTFQTLSASKATIDQASADYSIGTIKQTSASYKAINELKAAQTVAVNAMVTYESIKAAKGTATALSAQQQIVAAALSQLAPLIASVKGLYNAIAAPNPTPGAMSQLIRWPVQLPIAA